MIEDHQRVTGRWLLFPLSLVFFIVCSSPLILSSHIYHTNLAVFPLVKYRNCAVSPHLEVIARVTASTEKVCPLLRSLPEVSEIPSERIVPHRRDYSDKWHLSLLHHPEEMLISWDLTVLPSHLLPSEIGWRHWYYIGNIRCPYFIY